MLLGGEIKHSRSSGTRNIKTTTVNVRGVSNEKAIMNCRCWKPIFSLLLLFHLVSVTHHNELELERAYINAGMSCNWCYSHKII